jgi:hypothetical protein
MAGETWWESGSHPAGTWREPSRNLEGSTGYNPLYAQYIGHVRSDEAIPPESKISDAPGFGEDVRGPGT